MSQWEIVSGKTIENEVLDLGKLIKNEKNGRQTLTYECVADNGIGDALRKSITISYNGEWLGKGGNGQNNLN